MSLFPHRTSTVANSPTRDASLTTFFVCGACSYGAGVLLKVREDGVHVVNLLAFGGVAFVTPEVVTVASHVRGDAVAVSTPYGAGWLLRVREDGVHEVGGSLSLTACTCGRYHYLSHSCLVCNTLPGANEVVWRHCVLARRCRLDSAEPAHCCHSASLSEGLLDGFKQASNQCNEKNSWIMQCF